MYPLHFLFTFGGVVGAALTSDPGKEIWSCGIRHMIDSAVLDDFDPEQWLDDNAVPALTTWFPSGNAHIAADCWVKWAKMNAIGADGKYVESVTHERLGLSIGGAGATAGSNYQDTVVLSWRTNAASRGPASKGRIYSPRPDVSTSGTTGLFAAADALQMATAAATFLNTLDASIGVTGFIRPAIISDVPPGGAQNQVDWVYVDNRVDTQRRRANSLVAATSQVEILY